MTLKLFWDEVIPDIVRLDFEDEWTLADQELLVQKTHELLGEKTRRNDVIIYVHPGTHFPRYLPPGAIRRTVQSIPENPGVRVVVGAPMIVRTVIDLFTMMIGDKLEIEMLTANSLDSAREIIRQRRANSGIS